MDQSFSLFQGESYPQPQAKGKRILVVGSGQSARSTAAAVAAVGANPVIVSPDPADKTAGDGIQVLSGEVTGLIGLAGSFRAYVQTASGLMTVVCGGVVLAADSDLSFTYADPAPAVTLDGTSLAAAGATADGATLAVLTGFWNHAGPESFRRGLEAALSLSRAGGRVFLFAPQAKVAGEGVEELYRRVRQAGVVVTRLAALPEMAATEGGVRLSYEDPILPGPVAMTAAAVLADPPAAPLGFICRAAQVMELTIGPDGWPVPDNLLYPPPLTSRAGVWAVGGARGPDSAVLGEDLSLLGVELAGYLAPEEGSVAVRVAADRSECATCLTCFRACPVRAIGWDLGPIVMESVCLSCGQCAAVCPAGIIKPTWAEERELVSLLEEKGEGGLVLACGRIPDETLKALPEGVRVLSLSCAGRLSEEVLLRLAANGWQGITVAACHHDNCRSLTGSRRAQTMVETARELLGLLDLDSNLIRFVAVAPNQPGRLAALAAVTGRRK